MVVVEDGKKTLKLRAEHLRCNTDEVNLYERDLFQKGQKLVCIISDAASSGISLQVSGLGWLIAELDGVLVS